MKKFLSYLIFFLLTNQIVQAKNYNIGDIVRDNFEPGQRLKINLSPGNWQVVYKSSDLLWGMTYRGIGIVRVENNELMEAIEVEYLKTGGQYQNSISDLINELLYKDPYQGCYERPDNYFVERYKKGKSNNCIYVKHLNLPKLLTNPDDPDRRGLAAQYNKWQKSSGVKIPNIVLMSNHAYFSQMTGGTWYWYGHIVNPKVLNAPESRFQTTDTSEYHKFNVEQYPEHKKIIDKWVSIAAKNHKEFEKNIKAKPNHYLNLSKYITGENEIEKSANTSIVNQIKELNELYKSGAITKEEFEKAKKKLLD